MRVIWLAAGLWGCTELPLDAPVRTAHVVFDPAGGVLPLPNDLVRDAEAGHLDLPIDAEQSQAEQGLRAALNTQDAWSTVSALTFELSEAIEPASVGPDTVQVWEWGEVPAPVPDLVVEIDPDGRSVAVLPPLTGWARGGHYAVFLVGGQSGLRTVDGLPIGPDAAFWYLRMDTALDAHPDAFPGDSRAERQATADALEAVRQTLQPTLELAHAEGVPREMVSAAWEFSITRRPEVAMDPASQRMPLPFDLLIDPATGRVDLPASPDDDALERDAKVVASTLTGFALSANLHLELTAPVDPDTVSADTLQLWDLTQTPVQVPAAASAWSEQGRCSTGDRECVHIVVDPIPMPLTPGTRYAVVVREGLLGVDGEPVAPMAIGQLLRSGHPLVDADGASQIPSVDSADAVRIEPLRAAVAGLVDSLGRDTVVTAWPFTTLDPIHALRATVQIAESMTYDPRPTVTRRGPAVDLFGDDPLSDLFPGLLNPAEPIYLPRIDGVAEVIEGTIPVPVHLHPETRRWTEPPVIDDVHFMATIPEGVEAGEPVPVVIFGHAVVTDRRFVLTVAGELSKRGFATISIDFPYHGERIACVDASLVAVPNFFPEAIRPLVGFTDTMIWLPPCASGDEATCSPTGECLGPDGTPEPFNAFPIVDIRPAAGAAFLDVHDLPHVPDHFRQALVDLGALRHSLQTADWNQALGRPVRTDKFFFAGQSLGAILGAVYVASDPTIVRAVLNVPGADLVSLFDDSDFFGPQMDDYLAETVQIERGTWEEERLLAIARWLLDSVDPHSVGHIFAEESDRIDALIQIDRINGELGDIVIPNHTTDTLQQVSGLPMLEYPSVLHGDLVIPLIGDAMLVDLADFLAGDF